MFFIFNIGFAQETITLVPYIKWLTKKTDEKKRGKLISIFDLGFDIKPSKLPVKFSIETKTVKNSETSAFILVRTTARELVFIDVKPTPEAKLNYFIRIFSKDRSIDGVIDEQVSINADLDVLVTAASDFPIIYQRIVSLPKGKYIAELLITDFESGNKATKKLKFEIK